ncbi:MAG TPA: hypothetical protein VIT91_05705 [Chthoniobacterales bacterium]
MSFSKGKPLPGIFSIRFAIPRSPTRAQRTEAPLAILAEVAGTHVFGAIISIGIVISFPVCTLASVNAGARIIYALAKHGLIHESTASAHHKSATPQVAGKWATLDRGFARFPGLHCRHLLDAPA